MVLVTRPNHDLLTTYLYYFSGKIIDFYNQKSKHLIDLKGKIANNKMFDSYVSKNKPNFIFLNGHGSENYICGHNNEILVDDYKNEYKGTIFYARSCRSANKLGHNLVKEGTGAFIGYKENYFVLLSRQSNTHPLRDFVAKMFLEPSNLIALSIIRGNTVQEANEKSKQAMIHNLKEVLGSNMLNKNEVVAYLLHDINCQTIIGDQTACIAPI